MHEFWWIHNLPYRTMKVDSNTPEYYVYGSVHHWSILITVQRVATQSSLFIILQVHSTCFGCQPHPSSGVHKTVTTVSGTVRAATSLQRGQASLATLERGDLAFLWGREEQNIFFFPVHDLYESSLSLLLCSAPVLAVYFHILHQHTISTWPFGQPVIKHLCGLAANSYKHRNEHQFNLFASAFKWLQSTFTYDILFARHLNFSTWVTKNVNIPGTKKDRIMD